MLAPILSNTVFRRHTLGFKVNTNTVLQHLYGEVSVIVKYVLESVVYLLCITNQNFGKFVPHVSQSKAKL